MNKSFTLYGCSDGIEEQAVVTEITIESLVELYKKKEFSTLVECGQQFVKGNPSSAIAWNLLALGHRYSGNVPAALKIYEDLLKLNPNNFLLSTNLGNLYMAIGQIAKAIKCFETAREKQPNHTPNLEALAIAYQDSGKNSEAIVNFKKVLEIDDTKESSRYHLARMLVRLKSYDEAIKHFEKTDFGLSKSHQLECFYYLGDKENFYKNYKSLIKSNKVNPLMSSIGTHASVRYDVSNKENPFCSKPLAHIKEYHLDEQCGLDESLIDSILDFYKSGGTDGKSQPLLSNGKQSSGNLFLQQREDIQTLKAIIEKKISEYLSHFKKSNEGFIKKWPKKYTLYGWLVAMQSGGQLGAHIHKEGWLSGSLYFKMPEKRTKDEGNIVFSLDGANYPKDGKKFPKESKRVNKGDLVMFPSSLFHHTIPFESQEERVSFAFDVIPNK